MDENIDKTLHKDSIETEKFKMVQASHTSTAEIFRKSIVNDFPAEQHGFIEIFQFGHKPRCVELNEEEAIIGRSPECDILLTLENVSRRHARVVYTNEEYLIEDMESTNGVYVNGIKVERCNLRNHDQIEIGGIKILFYEDKIRKKT
jgi:pSer/pThr/pTyr-binding forkhead associated (FHA) protein